MNTYTVKQMSEMTGFSVKTFQKWDRDGKLVPSRTPTNRRVYTDEHLAKLRGINVTSQKSTIVYMRVSSQAQKPDLKNQRSALEQFCAARGLVVTEWIEEIGGWWEVPEPGRNYAAEGVIMETSGLKENERIIDGVLHYLDDDGQYVPYTVQALTVAVTALRAGYVARLEQIVKLKAAMLEAMTVLRKVD